MQEEVDLPALRRLLVDLSRKVEQAQARVIDTIETKHAEFVTASDQVSDLRSSVEVLRADLQRTAAQLREPGTGAGAAAGGEEQQEGSLVAKLRSAIAEHAAVKAELDALDAAAVVLRTMLQAQRQFGELDKLTSSARYCEAADLTLEIARALQGISAPDASAEPRMVRAAKTQYYQRRAILTSRLEDALSQLVAFGDRCATVRRSPLGAPTQEAHAAEALAPTSLQQVWEALQVLDLRDRRVEQLAQQLHRAVLWPLLEAARRLPQGQGLRPRTSTDRAQDSLTWTWVAAQDDGRGIENRAPAPGNVRPAAGGKAGVAGPRPPAQVVLPVLEALFLFLHEHLSGGSGEVYALLGKRLWPPVASSLVQHFDTCGSDGGEALERFEVAMYSKGLIGGKEKTLSRHVHEHRHALGEQRRASALAEARAWLLQGDPALVPVCDAEEPGSVTQILQRMEEQPQRAGATAAEAALEQQAASAFVGEKLRHALRDDAGLLRLPKMSVSAAVHKLVGRVRGLMEEIVTSVEQGRVEAARDLNRLVRELCTLFSVLRPYTQKGQLKTSAQCCAVFLADCLYLVHVLILMPYTYGRRLPGEHQQLALFVDLVPQLRRLGENHFLQMLRHQQEQLTAALRPCDFASGVAQDSSYIAAESALGAAVQQVKLAAQGLSAALPAQLLREVTGLLLGVLCRDLLGKLFRLQHVPAEEVGCLSALLTSALVGSRQIFAAVGLSAGGAAQGGGEDMGEDVPGWAALTVVADLLGSGFSRFSDQREALLKALKKEEVLKLMHLSWRDEFLSPEEAWNALTSGE